MFLCYRNMCNWTLLSVFQGAGMILSLEESMAEHKREKFRSIFVCTMTGLTLLYIAFGVSGYASFGPRKCAELSML